MKPSNFAAVVFIVIGVFGAWKILQYKEVAQARAATISDAATGDASAGR